MTNIKPRPTEESFCLSIASATALSVSDEILKALLEEKRKVWYPVASSCMSPMLRPGDFVLLEACRHKDLRIGDIIVRQMRNRLYVHRIIKQQVGSSNIIITSGDLCQQCDPPVAIEQVVARCEGWRRPTEGFSITGAKWHLLNRTIGRCSRGCMLAYHRLRGGAQNIDIPSFRLAKLLHKTSLRCIRAAVRLIMGMLYRFLCSF